MQASPRRKDYLPLLMSAILVVAVGLTNKFPVNRQFRTENILTFITSPIGLFFERLWLVAWVFGLAIFVVSVFRKNWNGLILFFVGVITTLFDFVAGIEYAGQFVDEASVRDSHCTEYHLLNSNFLQGTNVVIAKVIGRTGNETKYQVLVQDPGKEGGLQVVRKQGMADTGSLILTPNGLLVGLLYGPYCVDAYDLKNNIPYGAEMSDHKVKELSPFLLLQEGDVPSEEDFQSLIHPTTGIEPPDIAVIKKDLASPIPIVRELAAKYLKHSGR
jgi:hypothetical protein